MSSFSPQSKWVKLSEDFVNDLMTMWSAKYDMSDKTQTNLRRQLETLQYDPESIRRWQVELMAWKSVAA